MLSKRWRRANGRMNAKVGGSSRRVQYAASIIGRRRLSGVLRQQVRAGTIVHKTSFGVKVAKVRAIEVG